LLEEDPIALRRRIGYVIQQAGLFPHMSVAENVRVTAEVAGWPRERMAGRVEELLTLVGLDPAEYQARYPRQLSGGEQQRVGLARALTTDPALLLMDEPFGALDAQTRSFMQELLLSIWLKTPKTILFVTHDIDESVYLADRIAVLTHSPTEVKELIDVGLPAPRDQIATKELPEFAHLRAHVYRLIKRERPGAGAVADEEALAAAGIEDLFEARIDGVVAEREKLEGKPAPDTFLAGAKALGVEPGEAAVFEDALVGVEAGKAGHFGWVVGVNRSDEAQAKGLREHGADVVVEDLAELVKDR